MRNKIEQSTPNRALVRGPIPRPDFLGVPGMAPNIFRIVDGPALADVVHRADEKIPRREPCEFFDPRFLSFDKIALEPEADRELWKLRARFFHFLDVTGQILAQHAPVVERL